MRYISAKLTIMGPKVEIEKLIDGSSYRYRCKR